ncbi:uncharacterized protein LOC115879270 [Sitophilus oryzae]|uniref:Uncharacterized protein LOC115879270 n=1 Tax=Sitophilus oryzae TaxID=7048 RepID=A0A6J2XMG1_SITOR|nr:uncharacterized protein LOC115879270 [Sitophilus oryzae]
MISNSIVVLCVLFGLSASDFMHTSDKTYFLSTENLNWTDAREACIDAGLELASVRSNEERDAIEAFLKEYNPKPTSWYGYWLAGIKYPNGTFYWDTTDIEVGDNVENGWLPDEPNDAFNTENCLELKWDEHHLGWNDFSCDEEKPYICQNPRKEDSNGNSLDDYSFLLKIEPRNQFEYAGVHSRYIPFIKRSPAGFQYFDLDSYIKFHREIIAQSNLDSTTPPSTTHAPIVGSTLESVTTTNNPESLVESSSSDYVTINRFSQDLVQSSEESIATSHTPEDLVISDSESTTIPSQDLAQSNIESTTQISLTIPQYIIRAKLKSVTLSPAYLARSDMDSVTTSTTEKLDELELEPTRSSVSDENSDFLDIEPLYYDW